MPLIPHCPKCKKQLDTIENVQTKGNDLVCYDCSGVDLFIVERKNALWRSGGRNYTWEQVKSIVEQSTITEESAQTAEI